MTARKNIKSAKKTPPQAIVILYDGFDMLDVAGPFALMKAGTLNPVLVGLEKRPYTSLQGVKFIAEYGVQELGKILSGDYFLWIPGGAEEQYQGQFYKNNPLFIWLAKVAKKAVLVVSVCTGAHIAAAAGLLKKCKVTTHWAFQGSLALFDLTVISNLPTYPRYYYDKNKKVLTGGGISSGLDEAIFLISILTDDQTAMSAQLLNQYQPNPIFNSGTPQTAPREVYESTSKMLKGDEESLSKTIKKFLS